MAPNSAQPVETPSNARPDTASQGEHHEIKKPQPWICCGPAESSQSGTPDVCGKYNNSHINKCVVCQHERCTSCTIATLTWTKSLLASLSRNLSPELAEMMSECVEKLEEMDSREEFLAERESLEKTIQENCHDPDALIGRVKKLKLEVLEQTERERGS